MPVPDLEILLPVHNEAGSIEAIIREIHGEISARLAVCFIVCEDGSRDDSKQILTRLAEELPIRLNLCDGRRGYSQAVCDGMMMLEAPFLLCLDSDGQCDPKDFWAFWEARDTGDVVFGWRVKRADTLMRRICSRLFKLIYMAVLGPPVHDPSCPYVLMKQAVAVRMVGELGAMREGFWWEFIARVHRRGGVIRELPVRHRLRLAGQTQVYGWWKLPGIFVKHLLAIFQIWAETRA